MEKKLLSLQVNLIVCLVVEIHDFLKRKSEPFFYKRFRQQRSLKQILAER